MTTLPPPGCIIRCLKPTIQPHDMRALLLRLYTQGCRRVEFAVHAMMYTVPDPKTGATIAWPPTHYYPNDTLVYSDLGQDGAGIFETCPPENIYAYTKMAYDIGFERVVIKFMVDPHWPGAGRGGWRGYVWLLRSLRNAFADSHYAALRPYADVAQKQHAGLCFGTEWFLISREYGSDFWLDQVSRLEEDGFSGDLTYSANWGPHGAAAEYRILNDLFRKISSIGISWYMPSADAEDARKMWREAAVVWKQMKKDTGRDVELMEVGWPNTSYAFTDPYGATNPPGQFTTDVSKEAARIFMEEGAANTIGYYVWDAHNGTAGAPGSHALDADVAAILFATA